ncbi:MAG: hypothetical protein IPG23_04775 [Burkholderiales bacterium]|nr:hypothetical protein [Burkholderiales bacterium]
MKTPLTRSETGLLAALALAVVLACFGPAVAQYADYHAFADQRSLWGMPFAMDVLSNAPFALLGAWGLLRLRSVHKPPARRNGFVALVPCDAQRPLAQLFFVGLLLTALCSSYYHLQPNDLGLTIDRTGMLAAFAGLMGLAAADRISARAGQWTAAAVLVLGPVALVVWAMTGNLLPWSVLQGGGMLLVVSLTLRKPLIGAWGVPLLAVIAWYVLAKLLELGDHHILALTNGLVSGHTLKHMAAAMAAWPVLTVVQNGAYPVGPARGRPQPRIAVRT